LLLLFRKLPFNWLTPNFGGQVVPNLGVGFWQATRTNLSRGPRNGGQKTAPQTVRCDPQKWGSGFCIFSIFGVSFAASSSQRVVHYVSIEVWVLGSSQLAVHQTLRRSQAGDFRAVAVAALTRESRGQIRSVSPAVIVVGGATAAERRFAVFLEIGGERSKAECFWRARGHDDGRLCVGVRPLVCMCVSSKRCS